MIGPDEGTQSNAQMQTPAEVAVSVQDVKAAQARLQGKIIRTQVRSAAVAAAK